MTTDVHGILKAYPSFIFREAATWRGKPTKGRRTFVVFIRDGFAHFGVSKCCKKDQFIRRRGLEIAIGRAAGAADAQEKRYRPGPDTMWFSHKLEEIGLRANDKHSVLARGILNQLNYLDFRQKAHI